MVNRAIEHISVIMTDICSDALLKCTFLGTVAISNLDSTSGIHKWNLSPFFIKRIKCPLIMNETKFTKTKTKMKMKIKATTTIAAMVIIATIIALPLAANKAAFAINSKTQSVSGSTMLKMTSPNTPVVIPLLKGLYDRKDVMFITTEVSDKTMKDQIGNFTGSPVNYAPNLTKSQDIGDLWVFKNGVKGAGLMGFQPNVFNSIPGDPAYTPLWRVNLVEWKTTGANATTTTPTILGSDDAIGNAANKGQITVTPTKVVVNCPIVQWGGNKDNTIPAGHI